MPDKSKSNPPAFSEEQIKYFATQGAIGGRKSAKVVPAADREANGRAGALKRWAAYRKRKKEKDGK